VRARLAPQLIAGVGRIRSTRLMRRPRAFLAFLLVTSCTATPDPPDFPGVRRSVQSPVTVFYNSPCSSFYQDCAFNPVPGYPDVIKGWADRALSALGETCLPPETEEPREAYRFLWLRSFDPPIAVRIEEREGRFFVLGKTVSEERVRLWTSPPPPMGSAAIAFGVRPLTVPEIEHLHALLESAAFWSMPTSPRRDSGNDGSEWILEGWRNRQYHVVQIWSPLEPGKFLPFAHLCQLMVNLSGASVSERREY